MQANPYILGFTAGELSPWLSTRFDLENYTRGAALIRNLMVQPYGGLKRRTGTWYIGPAASQNPDAVRLFPFRFSESDVLMLEFFPEGMRVYENGRLLLVDGEPYVLMTPWKTDEMVASLHITQVNDKLFVTSPLYAPMEISRYSNTSWFCRVMTIQPYPRETYSAQSTGLHVQMASNGLTAKLVQEGSSGSFVAEMALKEYVVADATVPSRTLFQNQTFATGAKIAPDLSTTGVNLGSKLYQVDSTTGYYRFYQCIRPYAVSQYNGSKSLDDYPGYFTAGIMRMDSTGRPYEVCGDWEIYTSSEWDAEWELWRSYDTPISRGYDYKSWQWTKVLEFSQNAYSERKNWALSGSEKIPCRMVLVCRACSSLTVPAMLYMHIRSGVREYKMMITSVQSSTQATAVVERGYLDDPTTFYTRMWSFGAFGQRNGYPRFSELHQGRLWFGGVDGLPTSLFASAVDDYENFSVGSNADDALHLTLATADQSRICWICPSRSLLVGTSESEWTLSAPDGGAISSANATFSRQASVGSENMDASSVENTVFYVQRGGKRMREISYKLEADGYTSTDTSLLAEHLLFPGVKEWCVQRGSNARVWVLMNDGSLAVLMTNMVQKVMAWQRVSLQGRRVCHIVSIAHRGSQEDDLWLVVCREDGSEVCLEYIGDEGLFVDGAGEVTPESAMVEAVAPRLAGLRGYVYPSGCPEEAEAIEFDASGGWEIPGFIAGTTYCYGASYVSEVETLAREDDLQYNAVRQLGRVKLRLLESDVHFEYRATCSDRWETYEPQRDLVTYPYTGAVRLTNIPVPRVGQGFALRCDSALDFRLISLLMEIDYHGR